MGDSMRPIPFVDLLYRIFDEYTSEHSVFGLPVSHFFRKRNTRSISLHGRSCATVVGPAAGPHTQLAQNIVTAYLAGGRFFELKTVQENVPPIVRPCIEAADEGYNTEWSSEFTIEAAYEEYIKAWLLLHLVEAALFLNLDSKPSFLFNMSIGYNLAGITAPRMDSYIDNLKDASKHSFFSSCLDDLAVFINRRLPDLSGLADRISPTICQSATLSTMHGCPPAEIENICRYLITEKELATYVKLNPTLLSYPVVRAMLDSLGFDDITLDAAAFAHDLSYQDAIPMLTRLTELAKEHNGFFGVKLTNTLCTVNTKKLLPGSEMYMSGRALFPLAITLAAQISKEFAGKLPISFSAGISEHNAAAVFAAGIRPITMATELLKPGGYSRLSAIAAKLETTSGWDMQYADPDQIAALAEQALLADYSHKSFRSKGRAAVDKPLPLVDCAVAPCVIACPIKQDIPKYIRLLAEGRSDEALAVIYANNPLPFTTAHICEHVCQAHCSRLDYEGSVLIRDLKLLAVQQGKLKPPFLTRRRGRGVKAAILGAGPAGLAAAAFLAREGFAVTVYEAKQCAGGTVRHIIPSFRIESSVIESDIRLLQEQGVEFCFNSKPSLTPEYFRTQGFKYILVAVGAGTQKKFTLPGTAKSKVSIRSALTFLEHFNTNPAALQLGKSVAVVGAGNTAMDACRAALRVPGVETAAIIYRRSRSEMPAHPEEYRMAIADGVRFYFGLSPERFDEDGNLLCQEMQSGSIDASGRHRPEPTGRIRTIKVDTVITAVGETANYPALAKLGLTIPRAAAPKNIYVIGDAHTGPSSVVRCIADARRTIDDICRKEDPLWQPFFPLELPAAAPVKQDSKKIGLKPQSTPTGENTTIDKVTGLYEAERCLECSSVCNKCVEVCPNRANIAVADKIPGYSNAYQIIHLDASCNNCGNCAVFCPWEGKPYQDKITLFNCREDFDSSTSPGFLLIKDTVLLRVYGINYSLPLKNGCLETPASSPHLLIFVSLFNKLYNTQPSLFNSLV